MAQAPLSGLGMFQGVPNCDGVRITSNKNGVLVPRPKNTSPDLLLQGR